MPENQTSTNLHKNSSVLISSGSGLTGRYLTTSLDFLGAICMLREEAAELFESSGIRTVKVRTAVVLEKNDSVLSAVLGNNFKLCYINHFDSLSENSDYPFFFEIRQCSDDVCSAHAYVICNFFPGNRQVKDP